MRFANASHKAIEAVQKGTPGEAIPYLEEALSISRDPAVLGNYGDALARCGRIPEAKAAFEEAIALAPHYGMAHYNLGVMHDKMDDYEASRQHYLDALECRVEATTLNNLGNACTYLLRMAEAEDAYRRAIKFGYFDALWNLSLCLMMRGKWREAWQLYEHRPQMREYRTHPMLWRGESIAGKRLLVITEQGLGDSVFMLRYIRPLRELGAQVTIACEPALTRLIQSSFPPADNLPPVMVMDKSQQPHESPDYVTLAMSLPGYLSPDGVGPADPYLHAAGATMTGFNVGICWNGSTVVGPPKERNIALKLLAPLAAIDGVRLVSLQKGNAVAEMDDCGFEIHDAMAGARDVYDTACVIASLDLVISVDTLIPHLAAALGKPVWLMNRFMSCWQWGTPEYDPSLYGGLVAQFRQPAWGEWGPVVQQVTAGLEYVARSRAAGLA
jgi:Tfp pilus assembly protein PilF